MVAVDWHHTLEVHGHVSKANIDALEKLWANDIDVVLCSWGGEDRNKDTDRHSSSIWGRWEYKLWPKAKRGWKGKGNCLRQENIKFLFEDSWEVIEDCRDMGITCFPIVPKWLEWKWQGWTTYRTFAEAVDDFLHYYT